MDGPGGNEIRKWSLSFMTDALLGREGRSLTAEQLRSFYAGSYLERNPELDVADAPYKAALMSEACTLGGLSRAASVLEIGCGSGALLKDMKERLGASRAFGIDYSTTIAAAGRARFGHEVARADGVALPFRTGAFDVAYFADVLEHVLEPERFLREVARVGRRILFFIPIEAGVVTNAIYLTRRLRGKRTTYEQYGHIWRWNRGQIFRLLRAAGIELEGHRCFQAPPRLEGMNQLGRLMETIRSRTGSLSSRAAEVLFGTGAFVGVGRRAGAPS
jgi:SAM-dependent methyltransferase